MNDDSDTFEIIAEKSIFIEHDPIMKEKKKKKDNISNDTINKPTRKKNIILISGKMLVSLNYFPRRILAF